MGATYILKSLRCSVIAHKLCRMYTPNRKMVSGRACCFAVSMSFHSIVLAMSLVPLPVMSRVMLGYVDIESAMTRFLLCLASWFEARGLECILETFHWPPSEGTAGRDRIKWFDVMFSAVFLVCLSQSYLILAKIKYRMLRRLVAVKPAPVA